MSPHNGLPYPNEQPRMLTVMRTLQVRYFERHGTMARFIPDSQFVLGRILGKALLWRHVLQRSKSFKGRMERLITENLRF